MSENAHLEMASAQALYAARALERALHDPGPWTISLGDVVVEATRTVDSTGVTFTAEFPDLCWLERSNSLILRCRGEVAGIRPLDEHPGDARFVVTWELASSQTHSEVEV